jgi:DNA-binding protein HU-beta
MTKKDFIASVAEKTGLTKKDAEVAVNTMLDIITDELTTGGSVQLTGFGTFEVRSRKEKTCIVPQTKEKVVVPATKTPAFKPGKALKDAVSK